MVKRAFLVAAVCAAVSLPVLAATNVAKDGTLWVGSTTQGDNYRSFVVDGESLTQLDFSGYVAVTWDDPRPLGRVIVEQCPGYVIAGYSIYIAAQGCTDPNPAQWTDPAQWTLVKQVTGAGNGSDPSYAFTPDHATAGVLFVTDDLTGANGGVARIREIWAFENYDNLSPQAKFTVADGWFITNPGSEIKRINGFNDECTTIQSHSNGDPVTRGQYVVATFDEFVRLDSSCIVGGSSAASERLVDYLIQYFDYDLGDEGDWVTVLTVTGNTKRTDERVFDITTGESDRWRLCINSAQGISDNWARISEIMLFGSVVPEPATMTLLALGGLAMLRKRRSER
jgi:hypothetical protein